MSVGQFFLLYDDETEQNRKEENENKEYQRKEEIKKTKVESATRLSILLSIGTSCGRYLLTLRFCLFSFYMQLNSSDDDDDDAKLLLFTHSSFTRQKKQASDQRGENQDVNCDLLIHEYLLIENTLSLLKINLHSIT